MQKKFLFIINTMGGAGAETALLELLRRLDGGEYDISLYVVMGQGELAKELPPYVRVRNLRYHPDSVLSRRGKWRMAKTVCGAFFRNGRLLKKLRDIAKSFVSMRKQGRIQIDKLLWRMLSDGGQRFDESFDLAVAWMEGASAYYAADHVKAARKCAFIHIDYESAGYTREMDQGCWDSFDRIFMVSHEVKEHFLAVYPQYADKAGIFHNLVNQEAIRHAAQGGGFSDSYDGMRLLTVGRLTYQKAYDIAIDAMKLLKDRGCQARWYVLGEGDQRRTLERKIAALGLEKDFLLLGAVKNPYPYYAQTDLYIHASRFEGKSIAIQEAQTLGCAIIASDCSGNREQIENGTDGILCPLTPEGIADSIESLLRDEDRRKRLGEAAGKKDLGHGEQIHTLLELINSKEAGV